MAREPAGLLIRDAAAQIPDRVTIADGAAGSKTPPSSPAGPAPPSPATATAERGVDGVPTIEARPGSSGSSVSRADCSRSDSPTISGGGARRVALDSMPTARRAVLAALSGGEILTTSALAAEAGLHRHVARMRAEELEVIGVLRGIRPGADLEEEFDRRPVSWCLNGDDGQVIADVFKRHAADVGWHEIWVTHSSTPQE